MRGSSVREGKPSALPKGRGESGSSKPELSPWKWLIRNGNFTLYILFSIKAQRIDMVEKYSDLI